VKIVQLVTEDPDVASCPACRVVSTSGKDFAAGPAGYPTGTIPTGGSGGCARIRGRPGSSTSPAS